MPALVAKPDRLRVAAISFLNPAPLLWNFEHEPWAYELRERYDVHYTLPSLCAAELSSGEADLGLIPIGAMPYIPGVVAIEGCTIAALRAVRSIQLVVKAGIPLSSVRTVATDAASRSSSAYVEILLREMGNREAEFQREPADLPTMLGRCDAALLIGDPALLALERRDRTGAFADCLWHDVAELWHASTHLPWIAAVWAVRAQALQRTGISAAQLTADLTGSRDNGLAHIEDIVRAWDGHIAVPAGTLRTYLTQNIHYRLDRDCLAGIERFYTLGAEFGVLPQYSLRFLADEPRVSATSNFVCAS